MKIYIAAPWRDKEKMSGIAAAVEAAGHTITHKWWLVEDNSENARTATVLREQAVKDVVGVKDCQILLLINSGKSEGKSLEQGIAIANGKPIIAVGKLGEFSQNVFHYLSNYRWVDTLEEAIIALTTIKWLLREE